MTPDPAPPAGGPARYWPLLLPAAYLLHLAEEAWGGPGFVAWASRHLSPAFTADRFLAINAVAWPAMLAASVVAVRTRARWLVAALATVLLVNGAVHLASSLVTASYSPGLATGVLVYLPLGALALRRAAAGAVPGEIALGAGIGFAVHALVAYLAFVAP